MRGKTHLLAWFGVILSFGILCAQYYVQRHYVAGNFERTVRDIATYCGWFLVPLLLAVAYWRWARTARPDLPSWRQVVGRGFFVVLSSAWTVLASLEILGSLRPAAGYFNVNWLALLFAMCEIAVLFAVFLKYESRSLGLASAFLMMAWLQAGIYF